MLNLPHPIEARKAWEDAESWRLVAVVAKHPIGITVDDGGVVVHLATRLPADGLPNQIAFSSARKLIAFGTRSGQIVPIDSSYGVFGMLGDHDSYMFLKVELTEPPTADQSCRRCERRPQGDPNDLCAGHRGLQGMAVMFRANSFAKLEAAADAAAFSGPPVRFAAALRKLSEEAFPLEATRLVAKYERAISELPSTDHQVLVLSALIRLAAASSDPNLVARFEARIGDLAGDSQKAVIIP